MKSRRTGKNVSRTSSAWHNTVRADGSSTAKIFFRWEQRQHLPMMHTQCSKKEFDNLVENWDRVNHTRIKYANRGTRPPSIFQADDKVLMRDHFNKKWTRPVMILEVKPDFTSYVMKTENGENIVFDRTDFSRTSGGTHSKYLIKRLIFPKIARTLHHLHKKTKCRGHPVNYAGSGRPGQQSLSSRQICNRSMTSNRKKNTLGGSASKPWEGGIANTKLPNEQHQQQVEGVPHLRAPHPYAGERCGAAHDCHHHCCSAPCVQEATVEHQVTVRISKILVAQ